jgi:hypothetical protein
VTIPSDNPTKRERERDESAGDAKAEEIQNP